MACDPHLAKFMQDMNDIHKLRAMRGAEDRMIESYFDAPWYAKNEARQMVTDADDNFKALWNDLESRGFLSYELARYVYMNERPDERAILSRYVAIDEF